MESKNEYEEHGQVIFRKMTMEDIPSICLIEQECFTTPWTEQAFVHELTSNLFAHYTILEVDGNIAGYGGMWIVMDEAHITNIAIRAPYRGKKLGEGLLRYMQALAVSSGAKKMTLEVRKSNQIAQNLYAKLGFKSVGIRKGYYSDNGEDAVIMWAHII